MQSEQGPIMRAENVSSGEMYSVHSPHLSGTALNICGILTCHSNFACKFISSRIQRRHQVAAGEHRCKPSAVQRKDGSGAFQFYALQGFTLMQRPKSVAIY